MKHDKDKALKTQSDPAEAERVYVPLVDIYEKDDAVRVRCDMPGVPEEAVDIRLENTELEIKARQTSDRPEGYELVSGEYDTGIYYRRFTVPQLIDRDRISARLQNGVLDIELPKAKQAQPRRIEVR